MNNHELLATIRNRDEQIHRLRAELQNRASVNYEEKYKKALKSIEDIIKANRQIKQELDALRAMRQAEHTSLGQVQREQFQKSYDALLKEKNGLVSQLQSLELENQKLHYTISDLQNQLQGYKNQRYSNTYDQSSNNLPQPNDLPQVLAVISNNPGKKSDNKQVTENWKEKEAEFHRTLQSYEDHNSNLSRINKRLEEKVGELETKVINTEKQWRNKLDTKQLELIDAKSQIRQQFTEQISALRKENSNLKVKNNDLSIKLQSSEKNYTFNSQPQFDWQADLVQEMIAVKSNLEPLRQQISELQEVNIYEKEQSVRQRTNLRTQVLELEAEVERQTETIKSLEKKIVDGHQETLALEEKSAHLRRLEEENELLQGRMIVMESREVALRNRTGQELEERVLQFENRVELLLNNKQGLKELKQINIHQLLALKAYIMQLDSKIKQLLSSNTYLTKKYKSYKQKYQASLKEQKNFNVTINSLKMKIVGYDKLVLKLQEELEYNFRQSQTEMYQVHTVKSGGIDEGGELYRKKYEMVKEKLEIQEKYKLQEMETLKLNYQTKIMELAIQLDEMRSLKETLELYRLKNEELQMLLTRKESEVYQSNRVSQPMKGSGISMTEQQQSNIRQTKDIINNLHLTIKQSDQTIFKLQTQLRTKEDTYKKTINRLERELADVQETHSRESNKKDIQKNIEYEAEIKKYKSKVSDLEHELHLAQISQRDEYSRKTDSFDFKLKQLEQRVQEAEEQREEEIFIKRRVEKQNLSLQGDKEELEATVRDLEGKLLQMKQLERENFELKYQTSAKPDTSYLDFELQSKDNTIRQLKSEILQLRSNTDTYNEKDLTISSLRNEIYHLKQEIQDHNDLITRYNSQITMLKTHVDSSKLTFNTGLEGMLQQKDATIGRMRKDLTNKQFRISELEQQYSVIEEELRRLRRDGSQLQYLRQELEAKDRVLNEKSSYGDKLRYELSGHEEEVERYRRECSHLKENIQRMSTDLLEKDDEISRLKMEVSTSNMRSKEQFESRLRNQLEERERQFNKLSSDYNTLRSMVTMLQDEKQYQQDSYRRTTNELSTLRSQLNQLQDENATLSQQIYQKNQQFTKMSINVQNSQMLQDELAQKDSELAKMRADLFALKTGTSALQDQIYQKQANTSRMLKQLSYIRQQYNQLQHQHTAKQESFNRLTQELNTLRRQQDEHYNVVQERDMTVSRLTMELNNYKNRYRQLQEEMEQREQQFTNYHSEIATLKSNITYHQDEVDQKQNQIVRSMAECDKLRNQTMSLNQQLTDKNMQINRLKQQIFAIKMQISQNQYDQQFKQEQEVMAYRSKITMLEHDLEDKEAEIRRLGIELETSRYKPTAYVPEISEDEVQELRNEVNKKQRELIAMKFQLDDKVYQADSANSTMNMLKQTISELQQTQENDRGEFDRMLRQASGRQRRLNDELLTLRQQLQRLSVLSQTKPKSYAITYTEQQMSQMQDKLSQKQTEIIQMRNGEQQKLFYIETLESKIQMQERLIGQLEQQAREDQERVEGEIQEYIRRERELRNVVGQLQMGQGQERASSQGQEYQVEARMYLEQIDRLNNIIQQLQDEVESFKLKLSSMINQQSRIEQNLITMVLLMTEIESLRERVKAKESEINQVRKSFIQMAVAGELESNKMSRLVELAQERHSQEQESHERLQGQSFERQYSGSGFASNAYGSTLQHISEMPSVEHFAGETIHNAAPVQPTDKGFKKEASNYYEHNSSSATHQRQSAHYSHHAQNQSTPFQKEQFQQPLEFNGTYHEGELPPGSGSERYMDNYYQDPVNMQDRELEREQEEEMRMRREYEEEVRRQQQLEMEGGQREIRRGDRQPQQCEEQMEQQQYNQQMRRQDRKKSFINQLEKQQYDQPQVQPAQPQPQQQLNHQQLNHQQQRPQPQQVIRVQQSQQQHHVQQIQQQQTLTQSRSSRGQITITIQNSSQVGLSRSGINEPRIYQQQPPHHSMIGQGHPQPIRIQQQYQPQPLQRSSYHMGQHGISTQHHGSPPQGNVVRVSPNHTVIYPQGVSPGHFRQPY